MHTTFAKGAKNFVVRPNEKVCDKLLLALVGKLGDIITSS